MKSAVNITVALSAITFFFLTLSGCIENDQSSYQSTTEVTNQNDSIRVIPQAKSAHLLENDEYVIKIGELDFSIQAGLRKDSVVALRFNYYHPLTFDDHLKYQHLLLDEVMKKYGKYPINSVFLGRLIYTGDLAVEATYPVLAAGWDRRSYPKLKEILDTGVITKKYSQFFSRYNATVEGVSFEKAFMLDKNDIHTYSTVTIPTDSLPDQVLDAMVWLILK